MANAFAPTATAPLPLLPPVPAGPQPFFQARGLAALIAALDDAIISYRGATGEAIVVIVGGRVVDAIAVSSGRPPLMGLEALNALGATDPTNLRASAVDRRIALALPTYWREVDRLPPISTLWVDAAGLIEAVIRPGRRGVVVLRSPSDLGIVLFDEGGLVAAYSERRPEPGGLETLAPLMADAQTTIHGRIADASSPSSPAARQRPDEGMVALPDSVERCRGEILRMAEATLHRHAVPVVACFRAAPRSPQGLLLAAEEVRTMRLRLISPATLNTVADRAQEIVRVASRGT